jgi:hypothetical protein
MGQSRNLIVEHQGERSESRTHVPNSVSSLLASAGAAVNSNFMTRGLTRIIEVWSCNCVTAAARVIFEGSGETFVKKERDMVFGSGRRVYRRRPSLMKALELKCAVVDMAICSLSRSGGAAVHVHFEAKLQIIRHFCAMWTKKIRSYRCC